MANYHKYQNKEKTEVFMRRSVLDHGTIHKEGTVEYRIALARDYLRQCFKGIKSDKPCSSPVRDSLQISVKKLG